VYKKKMCPQNKFVSTSPWFRGGGGIWTRVHQRRTRASPGASTIACSWPASYSWPC